MIDLPSGADAQRLIRDGIISTVYGDTNEIQHDAISTDGP